MLRNAIVALALVGPACAQFAQLAATDDGRQVYLTSQLLLRGSAPKTAEARLYRLGPEGVSLFAERGALADPAFASPDTGVAMPQISGDGGIVGFTAYDICTGEPTCTSSDAEALLRGKQDADLGPGKLQLSRNGRWALLTDALTPDATLVDLSTGQRTAVPPAAANNYSVASDGTILAQREGAPGLWKQGQFTAIQPPADTGIVPLALSDDAGTLIFNTAVLSATDRTTTMVMSARDLASGKDTTLFSTEEISRVPTFMAVGNNGRRVLYRTGAGSGPAFFADTSTGLSQAIQLPGGELVSDGTLSGSGDFALLVTTAGRLVRVALSSGAIEELIPATPYCTNLTILAAGSLFRLSLTDSAVDWNGRIRLDGRAMPVLWVKPGEVGVQVPWEQRIGAAQLLLDAPSASPFEPGQSTVVLPFAPQFEFVDPALSSLFGLAIVRGDFSALVTTPPGPGDIVHLYMTGLGPVTGPVETGAPASLTALNPITAILRCRFLPQATEAETLFAGLAPGMIGIYQVSFRMPADAGAPLSGINCTLEGENGASGFGLFPAGGVLPSP